MIILCDLDNCLANDSHRYHLIPAEKTSQKDWNPYHAEISKDIPNPLVVDLLSKAYEAGWTVVYSTARPDIFREPTEKWLFENYLWFPRSYLFMRKFEDLRPAVDVKRSIVHLFQRNAASIGLAIDDDASIVAMYREEGIPAVQIFCNLDQLQEWPFNG